MGCGWHLVLTGATRCLLSPAKLLQKVCEKEEMMADKGETTSKRKQIGALCFCYKN